MAEFLHNYELQYNKIKRLHTITTYIWIVSLICFFVVSIVIDMSVNGPLFIVTVLFTIAVKKTNQAFVSNVNTIAFKWMNDMDVNFALDVFRVLLQDKKRKDYVFVLSAYLNLLVIMCQFDEFDAVYQENQKLIQKSLYRILPFYREMFLGMMEDRSEYRDIIFQHKFSKYQNAENNLSKKGEALRKRDEQYMVHQLYELGDYEGLLEYLEKIHMVTRYDHILYGTYKQRCLWQLDHSYEMILPEVPEFFCIRYLKHLKEAGEPYNFERAKEFADRCKVDCQEGKKAYRKRLIAAFLGLFAVGIILGFFI